MKPPAKLLFILACFGAACSWAQDPPEADGPKKGGEIKEAEEGKSDEDNGALSIPIPVGRDAKGIRLPYFGRDGKIQMQLSIGSAVRLDERRLRMKDVKVQTFGEGGSKELLIDAPEAILDLETRVVTSDVPVTIKRSDFEVTGDNMSFDTKTKAGTFTGKTRMLIYDTTRALPSKKTE